jgi:hypothetical protein
MNTNERIASLAIGSEVANTDDQTTFYCTYVTNPDYDADWWISISPNTVLRNVQTGEELLLTDVKNITYSPEKVYLNNFGDAHHFILYFPPVPVNWDKFDLIELIDGENPFIFKDIKRNATGIYKKRI